MQQGKLGPVATSLNHTREAGCRGPLIPMPRAAGGRAERQDQLPGSPQPSLEAALGPQPFLG